MDMVNFLSLTISQNLLIFIVAGAAVWWAGTRLTVYADIISDKTGFDKAAMGFIFLSLATQLPEIVTNSTAALRGNATLVLNSMFGGITMQTAVLAVADFFVAGTTLTIAARKSVNILQGAVLILILAILNAIIVIGDIELVFNIGAGAILLALLYIIIIFLLWRYQGDAQWEALNVPDEQKEKFKDRIKSRFQNKELQKLIFYSAGTSLIILFCGVILVRTAEAVAEQTGLGASFIGVTLLASATSLPELSTTISAVRLGQHSMAISDILGSNLIMVLLILPSDILYREGVLLDVTDASSQFALAAGIIISAIYVVGLVMRKSRRLLGAGIDSWLVLTFYLLSVLILYNLR
jgi:cation:H+ antiporter